MRTSRLYRADALRAPVGSIDRDAGQILGFAVATAGEARGHDLDLDETTLEQIVALGNRRKHGIKARFGHPGMSSESLGTFLGRVSNFRLDGTLVRADLKIDPTARETPNGDLASYVLALAESDAEAFGSSIVWLGSREKRLDADGQPAKGPDGKPLRPVARVRELRAVDIVDDPAANPGGLFAAGFMTADCELSARATEFLDEFFGGPEDEVVDRLEAFCRRYSSASPVAGARIVAALARLGPQQQEDRNMERDGEKSAPEIPKVVPAPAPAETEAAQQAALAAAVGKALAAERARGKAIRECAFAGQDALVAQAIDEGWSVEAAAQAFIAARKKADSARLAELRTDTAPALGPNPEPTARPVQKKLGPEEALAAARSRWLSDPALRDEFAGDEKVFLAYEKATSAGIHRPGREEV